MSGELDQAESAFVQLIEQSNKKLLQAFERAIQADQSQGQIVAHIETIDLARQAIAFGDGALLRSWVSGNSSFAEEAFRAFLASIER